MILAFCRRCMSLGCDLYIFMRLFFSPFWGRIMIFFNSLNFMSFFASNVIFRFYLSVILLLFIVFGSFCTFEYYIVLIFFSFLYWVYRMGFALIYNSFLGWFHGRLYAVFYIFSHQFFCQAILVNIFLNTGILYLSTFISESVLRVFIRFNQKISFRSTTKLFTFPLLNKKI